MPTLPSVRNLALLLLSASAPFLLSSCAAKTEAESPGAGTPERPTVAVARVSTDNLSKNLILTAEFRPFQEIDVMAKVAGYVKHIYVDVGDRVHEDQLLAELEVPEMGDDLQHAEAALERSQAEVARAKDELRRAQSAHEISHISYKRLSTVADKKPGLIAQQEIDDAHSKDLVAEAQVSAAQSAINAASQQVEVNKADVQKIKTLMDYTKVTAPFKGVVTRRYADTGSMIQAGTASQTQAEPVVKLSQNNLLRLILPVPESAVTTVHIGQRVEVNVPTLHRTFQGRVARFADKLSLATRTMDTEVDVQNPGLILIPGMYAEVNLTLSQRNSVLTVPVTAVDLDSSNQSAGSVMVVTPTGRVEQRKINLGMETANRMEVRSGLNEGDLVVISGRALLQPNEEVRPKLTVLAASNAAGQSN